MKNNTVVVGYIEGYPFLKFKKWITSLRKEYAGDIAFIYKNITDDTLNKLKENNIISINVETLYKDYNLNSNLSPYNTKFLALYLCIKHNILDYEKYLFTDSTDVYFQTNPFTFTEEKKVHLTLENNYYGSCETNNTWILVGWGQEKLETLLNKKIINAGVLLADKENILIFLKYFAKEMTYCLTRHRTYPTFDQSAFNCVTYNNHTNSNIILHDQKYAIHLSGYKFKDLNIIDKLICDKDNKPFSIIHQYDCIGEINL
jgi:hypothetical protein